MPGTVLGAECSLWSQPKDPFSYAKTNRRMRDRTVQLEQIKCMDGAAAERWPSFHVCVGRTGCLVGLLASFSCSLSSFTPTAPAAATLPEHHAVSLRLGELQSLKFSWGPNHLFCTAAAPAVSHSVFYLVKWSESRDSGASCLHLPGPVERTFPVSERPPPRSAGDIGPFLSIGLT